ncbi:MAG: hypothetical protein MUO97_05500, partial [Dehalococcoidia bacterium]|nr:hypothetical protein [Dehalococcoidia bacterium]
DVLVVRVKHPTDNLEFYVVAVHAKSRYEGRATTDPRRIAAARTMVQKLKAGYAGKPFVLLGDFNDNPDDESMNILETADPNAVAGPEEIPGQFLVNLTEPLCAAGHVSHGLKSDAIRKDDPNLVNTIDPNSRMRNNRWRGTNKNTGDILFDQILIPSWMVTGYVNRSCKVFDKAVAVKGNDTTRASDHVPVYADFVFTEEICGD